MNTLEVIIAILTGLGIIWGAVVGWKQIRSTTAADQRAATQERANELRDARDEERHSCAERIQALRDDLVAMTGDRDYERGRADGLQALINTRGLKGES